VTRFLAIYNGTATDEQRQALSAEEQQAFMAAWAQWAQHHAGAIVDPGSPLFRKRLVTSTGWTELDDAKTGYTIIEAASHGDAVDVFSSHPHLRLAAGNSIEVLECPSIPS
jgi:hypothetical protein